MTPMIIVVVVLVALAIGFVVMMRREPPAAAVTAAREDDDMEAIVSEPEPIGNGATPRAITWTQQFEPRSGTLSDKARLKLINDLGLLRAPWCVPLLTRAYEEETDPAHRVAAQLALARCRGERSLGRTRE